jgi:hypothetical protein
MNERIFLFLAYVCLFVFQYVFTGVYTFLCVWVRYRFPGAEEGLAGLMLLLLLGPDKGA